MDREIVEHDRIAGFSKHYAGIVSELFQRTVCVCPRQFVTSGYYPQWAFVYFEVDKVMTDVTP